MHIAKPQFTGLHEEFLLGILGGKFNTGKSGKSMFHQIVNRVRPKLLSSGKDELKLNKLMFGALILDFDRTRRAVANQYSRVIRTAQSKISLTLLK